MTQKICFVTSSRADYWLLKPVLESLRESDKFDLSIIATASMLSPSFGYNVQKVEDDGFIVDEKIETLVSGDTPIALTKTMGLTMSAIGEAYDRLKPDLVLLPGDRYEMLMAAAAAVVSSIPIAHVYGGDITEGANDDSLRHAITKLSHLHLVSNEMSRKRVIQMGEHPDMVHNIGSPALDLLMKGPFMSRKRLEEKLGMTFHRYNLLITLHPETMHPDPMVHVETLLSALEILSKDHALIFTSPNADNYGLMFAEKIKGFVERYENAYFYTTLGQENYASLMNEVDMVVGNSSSGLYEAPSFKIPTVNIGERQRGRLQATSIIDAPFEKGAIIKAIETAKTLDCSDAKNPYGDGESTQKVMAILEKTGQFSNILQKKFYRDREVIHG